MCQQQRDATPLEPYSRMIFKIFSIELQFSELLSTEKDI